MRNLLRCMSVFAAIVFFAMPANAQEWPFVRFKPTEIGQLSTGRGVVVAVLDSGVDTTNSHLTGRTLPGAGFVGITGDIGQTDQDLHGTAVAAIVADLAPEAEILPLRVSRAEVAEPVALAKAIVHAADAHAGVITISLGIATPDPSVRAAVDYAGRKDAVVVAAAGNEGLHGNRPMYPASFPGVVSVSGVDRSGRFWADSESGPATTIAALATDIPLATGEVGSGTSFAAPYVAASAALVRARYPQMTAANVVARLTQTADPADGTREQVGAGIVNPLRALTESPAAARSFPWVWAVAALALLGAGFFLLRKYFWGSSS